MTGDLLNRPVVLVHGWGGSFESTWKQSGFTDLLADAGRTVIPVDLLGHGTAPKPTDPADYHDLTLRILTALPDQPCDAVGFSLGAATLMDLASRHPERFSSLVLAGIGQNVVAPDADDVDATERIVSAIRGTGDPADTGASIFAHYARQHGNDPEALIAVLRRPRVLRRPSDFATVTCRTLVILGDRDFAGPGDELVSKLPNASLHVLRNTDHFATPESFGFIDAALRFIGADPT